jgi:hypothetical protein
MNFFISAENAGYAPDSHPLSICVMNENQNYFYAELYDFDKNYEQKKVQECSCNMKFVGPTRQDTVMSNYHQLNKPNLGVGTDLPMNHSTTYDEVNIARRYQNAMSNAFQRVANDYANNYAFQNSGFDKFVRNVEIVGEKEQVCRELTSWLTQWHKLNNNAEINFIAEDSSKSWNAFLKILGGEQRLPSFVNKHCVDLKSFYKARSAPYEKEKALESLNNSDKNLIDVFEKNFPFRSGNMLYEVFILQKNFNRLFKNFSY